LELRKEVVYLQYQIKTQPQVYNMEIVIMENISIEILSEKLGGKLWIKEDKKRIYLDCGYNTKKMSTKTYVYQREDGTFGVSCYIDCPSQPYAWIQSQQSEVIESVERRIENVLADTVYLITDDAIGKVINDNCKPCELNDLYESDYFLSKPDAEKYISKKLGKGYSIKEMNREEFNTEVERLNEIERNLPLSVKIERGDSISFHKGNFEEIKSKIEADGIMDFLTINIYNDWSGSFKKKGENDKLAIDIINEKKSKEIAPVIKSTNKSSIDLNNGNRVSHKVFGSGTIISDDNKIIEIKFDSIDEVKKLIKAYAKLEKL